MTFSVLVLFIGLVSATSSDNLEEVVDHWSVEDLDSFYRYIDFWTSRGVYNSIAKEKWIYDHSPSQAGKIVGIVVGCLLILGAIYLLYRNRKQRLSQRATDGEIVLFERTPLPLQHN